jgi:hypothetical protein
LETKTRIKKKLSLKKKFKKRKVGLKEGKEKAV